MERLLAAEAKSDRIEKILRRPQVEEVTGLSRSTIYELMARGQFVRPVRLAGHSGRAVGWLESEVLDWQRARIAEREAA